MKGNNVYKPLQVQEKVLDIVESCFKNENKGMMDARQIALKEMDDFLIKTGDGSYTLLSEGSENSSETMHTFHGGVEESLEKYVKPSHLIGRKDVHVLDICSGLGYTAAICLEYLNDEKHNTLKNPNITIEMVEISPLTLACGLIIPSPIKSHEIVKKAIEDKLYDIGFLKYKMITSEIPDNIKLNLHITDAREIIKNLKPIPKNSVKFYGKIKKSFESLPQFSDSEKVYDAIFLVPFSPGVSPELYTLEFLNGLKSLVKDNGMLLTYTSSAAVRYTLVNLGLHVGEGPSFGRSGGTLASESQVNIEKPLSTKDERMIALTDAGTPFKDPELNDSCDNIIERRQNERSKVRNENKFASTVKSPVYLCNEIPESRLRRRVIKDVRKLGFEDLISEKSRYLVCPQYKKCICGNECETLESSRERIIEMEKRLSNILKIS